MKLRAIRVRDAGHFTNGCALEGLTGALDVLVAPNEAGKSTLFRALEAVFFERHTAAGKSIRDLTPHQGGSPLIEADFDIEDVPWRITKVFGRGKRAGLRQLSGPNVELRGADAEDALAKLLGLKEGQPGRLGFLWVGQGQALAPLPPDHKRGEAIAFQQIVEREVADLTGGTLLRQVRETIAADLGVLISPAHRKAKAHGPFDLAIKHRDALATELARAIAAQAEAEARRAAMAALKAQRQRLSAPERVEAAAEATAAARRAHEEAVNLRRLLKDTQHTAGTKDASARDAERAALAFKTNLDEWDRLESTADESRHRLAQLEQVLKHQLAHRAALERDGETLRQREQRSHEALRAADQAATLVQLRAQAGLKSQTLVAARALEAEVVKARAGATGLGVSEAALNQLMAADAARAHAQAALAGGAPKVTVSYVPGGRQVLQDGKPVAGGVLPAVEGPLRLEIPGVGIITIEAPASAGRERHLQAHTEALLELKAGLAKLGLPSVDAARARRTADNERAAALATAEARLSGLAPDGVDALAAGVAALDAQLANVEPQAGHCDGVAAQGELVATRAAIHDLGTAIRVCQTEIETSGNSIARERALVETSAARLAHISQELPAPVDRAPVLTQLQDQAAATRAQANTALRETAAVREAAPDDDALAALSRTVSRLRSEAAKVAAELREIDLTCARLDGEEAQADAHGLSQQVPALEGALQRAETEVVHFQREVDALSLLAETVQSAETANRDRFLSPVLSCLAPYLEMVFPGARLVFSGDFGVSAMERAAGVEALQILSRGTQEQLAVLVRLAFAKLLANAGQPTPLILDDALVYSDDERLRLMFAALAQGAKLHQVLVLSCHGTHVSAMGHRAAISNWEPG